MSNQDSDSDVQAKGPEANADTRRGEDSSADLVELMERYSKGDQAAFEQVFELMSPRLYAFHLRSLGSPSLAEDLTQQTFLKLHVARRRYRVGSPVAPWVFAIAKNVQRDRLRKRRRSREYLTTDGELPASAAVATPAKVKSTFENIQLTKAIAKLPEGQRDVIVLHKFQGMSMREVATTLGIGVSAAKVRAFRAYGTLRKLLEQERS